MSPNVYAAAGVNIEAGDDFSQFAGNICRTSNGNSPFVEVRDPVTSGFRGPKGFRLKNLPPDAWWDMAADGTGTKVVVVDAAGGYLNAACDLFAMTGGDITRYGGCPVAFCNILDVSTLGQVGSKTNQSLRQMMDGLGKVARWQHVVLYRGETAELGPCVGSENDDAWFKFNWGGLMLGVWTDDRLITGDTLAAGQVVVALQERGPRSNGLSAVRRGLRERYGDTWWSMPDAAADILAAVYPSTLYDRFLTRMNGWDKLHAEPPVKMHFIAHISGGGIPSKLAGDGLFPRGLSAELDGLFTPPEILLNVRKWTGMSEREAYETFSSGNGALVVLSQEDVETFIKEAERDRLQAQICGRITEERELQLMIRSGYSKEAEPIVFRAE